MKYKLDTYRHRVTDEQYRSDLRKVAAKLHKDTLTRDEYTKHGDYHGASAARRFGSWPKALEAAGLKVTFRHRVPIETALRDLKAVAERLGKSSLSHDEYETHGAFSAKPLIRAFGSWNKALKAAGLEVRKRPRIPDDELFANLEEVWHSLGRQPRYREFAKPLSKFSVGVYEHRFGSWREALEAFVRSVLSGSPEDKLAAERRPPEQKPKSVKGRPREVSSEPKSRHISWRLRFLVMRRDGFRCQQCGRSPATTPGVVLHLDHTEAWIKGGSTTMDNLRTLCSVCNIGKSDLPLEEKT